MENQQLRTPKVVILLYGKRKSGKDYFSNALLERLTNNAVQISVLHIANAVKRKYAEQHNLDYEAMLTSASYKEQYRQNLVELLRQESLTDVFYWDRLVVEEERAKGSNSEVWLVADCRRERDMVYFTQLFTRQRCRIVRVECSLQTRELRGFQFKAGIDDTDSECGLDDFNDVDYVVCNDEKHSNYNTDQQLEALLNDIRKSL